MRELLNLPQMNEKDLETVKNLIDCIAEKQNEECSHELDELAHITGKSHAKMDFAEYWGWTDLDTIAEITLMPEPPYVHDLKQSEMVEIVEIIRNCLVSGEDAKSEYYTELLHKSLPLANVMDYILSGNNATEIVDKMISSRSNSVIVL